MEDQTILLVDEKGVPTGEYESRIVCHTGKGKKHLAISVLIYNDKGELLLQKRKHIVHDNLWDHTASTHHLHNTDGTNETTEEATYRALEREYGIIEKMPLKVWGAIDYFDPDGNYCENEHDFILTGEYNGELKPNMDVMYEYKWMDKNEFLKDIEKKPDEYPLWAVKGTELLKERGFFRD